MALSRVSVVDSEPETQSCYLLISVDVFWIKHRERNLFVFQAHSNMAVFACGMKLKCAANFMYYFDNGVFRRRRVAPSPD